MNLEDWAKLDRGYTDHFGWPDKDIKEMRANKVE